MNNLPMGWVEVELEKFVQFAIGGDWGKDIDFDDENFTNVFCIRGAEFRNWEKEKGLTASPRKIKTSSFQTRKLQEDDILIEISGGSPEQPVGRTVLIEPNVFKNIGSDNVVCTNFIRLVRPFKQINSKYLNYYLSLFYKSPEINNYQSGSNNLRNLKFNDYLTILIPTTPKAEQDHIATLLDNHLSQVAKIEQKLKDILPIIKQFRQSVLAQAVSGRLIGLQDKFEQLEVIKLESLILKSGNGISKRQGENGKDVTVLRLADFKDAQRVYGNERQIILTEKEITQYKLNQDDILVIRVNGSVDLAGKFILYSENKSDEAYCDHFIRLKLDTDKILPKYMLYLANFGNGREYLKNSLSTSAGQNTINQTSIKNMSLKIPPLPEQQQIVTEVERLFAVADTIEKQVNEALERVGHLTQSILHQAFTGNLSADWRACNADLITGEHSATALLAQIQANTKAKPTKRTTKKVDV